MRAQTSFKEDLRRSLINHALVPFVCTVFVIILVITVIGFGMICRKNDEARRLFTEEYLSLMADYSEEVEKIGRELSLTEFENQVEYRVRWLEDVYHFLNRQSVRGDFYLFNKDFDLVYGMSRDASVAEYLENHLRSNRKDDGFWESAEFIYDSWDLQREMPPSCLLFRKIRTSEGLEGYGGFMISASRFSTDLADQNLSLIITNRFRRVFSENACGFCNERGKLRDDFRGNGVFSMSHRWYYAHCQEILDGEVFIYAVSDCTVFFHLAVLSSTILLLLSAIMIFFIQVSAGKIAAQKTEIIYQLVEVLEEVENGNLDGKLDIRSGDEFEMIGHTFNMMLESIRDLIDRQQQLTKENTLATMQALESQFNPHFLFNTLESIRYMIRLDASAAERMVVNLSKLLRYSIQSGEKMVVLGEELEFADKYLQIMLYRYGKRLRYSIHVDPWMNAVRTPRMILQPIIENSIKYGYGDRKTLDISITSCARKNGVEITVQDNGVGIEEELLRELREGLQHNHNKTGHIGIHNVHRRLCLLYGKEYGVTIESIAGQGTTVRLYLPDTGDLRGERNVESADCGR